MQVTVKSVMFSRQPSCTAATEQHRLTHARSSIWNCDDTVYNKYTIYTVLKRTGPLLYFHI